MQVPKEIEELLEVRDLLDRLGHPNVCLIILQMICFDMRSYILHQIMNYYLTVLLSDRKRRTASIVSSAGESHPDSWGIPYPESWGCPYAGGIPSWVLGEPLFWVLGVSLCWGYPVLVPRGHPYSEGFPGHDH